MFHKSNTKRENTLHPRASEEMKFVCLHCGRPYGNHDGKKCPTKFDEEGNVIEWEGDESC